MRILIVCREWAPVGGGIGVAVKRMTEELVLRGNHCDVLTMNYGELTDIEIAPRFSLKRISCRRKAIDSGDIGSMLRYVVYGIRYGKQKILDGNYDVILAASFVPEGFIGLTLSHLTKVPYAIWSHGSDVPGYDPRRYNWLHSLIRPMWRRIARNASTIIVPSSSFARLVSVKNDNNFPFVIPYGIDSKEVSEILKTRDFLICSRLIERKNFHIVLDALKKIDQSVTLDIVGDGPERERLEGMATQIQNHEVRFHGWLDNGSIDWFRLFSECRFFIMPSEGESFGMAPLEAQINGVIPLVSSIDVFREVLGDGALYFSELSEDGIRQTMLQALELSRNDFDRITRHSIERARVQFSWPAIAAKMEEQLLQVRQPVQFLSSSSATN